MAVLHPHSTTVPSYFLSRTAKSSVSSSPLSVTVVQAANGALDSNTSAVQMPPTLSGTLLPRPLRLDGRTLLPACLHALLPVRIGVLPGRSPSTPQYWIAAWKRSLALASAPADRNQRPKRASCIQISVHPLTSGHVMDMCRVAGRAWAGAVAYNGGFVHALRRATNLNSSLVLAVFGGHLGGQVLQFCGAKGKSCGDCARLGLAWTLSVPQPPASGARPSAGIYWAMLLFTWVQHPVSNAHSRFLSALCCCRLCFCESEASLISGVG